MNLEEQGRNASSREDFGISILPITCSRSEMSRPIWGQEQHLRTHSSSDYVAPAWKFVGVEEGFPVAESQWISIPSLNSHILSLWVCEWVS